MHRFFQKISTTMHQFPYHRFHIPVMGLAYTIDSPVKVARFGISSVISIVEDRLIEMMRKHYYPALNKEYYPISTHEEDYRARRITDYLDLVNDIVQEQVEKLKKAAFESGSEIVKYFEMLPDDSRLKQLYQQMMSLSSQPEKEEMENYLREQIKPGSIDVNIMTKIDRDIFDKNGELLADHSEAVAALRGYANSKLSNSSVVLSAGMNPRLYNYLGNCNEFDVSEQGEFTKKIIVKVSDYRSALIQGKYLAKKGIWVSEFRIESGLNCGGHAFATDGYLMGPILEEFKMNRKELVAVLFEIYNGSLRAKNKPTLSEPPQMTFSVQGGIGTHEEDDFLHRYYNIESTGWGTPFLLVPEATTVDEETLKLLCEADEKDVVLSQKSPLGVRFHYLKGTSSDRERSLRIEKGKPGSPCTEKHLKFNTEFTKEPICTASHTYQKLKIEHLQSLGLPENEYEKQVNDVMEKECLCVGLSNSAAINYKQTFFKTLNAVTVCPGPNIANFSKLVSLQTMTDHIYGRTDIVTRSGRPHMFIAELHLYINYLDEQLALDFAADQIVKKKKYYSSFFKNLEDGITYYEQLNGIAEQSKSDFIETLHMARQELCFLNSRYGLSEN
ncbi:MAG TPA: hypothetical protein VK166_19965 [Chitinophagaceae bacterium]|nr:hypothetical protein [Chitinophagaceae bacterium]